MTNNIVLATDSDREQLMTLYKEQVGREFCTWDEDYPSTETMGVTEMILEEYIK